MENNREIAVVNNKGLLRNATEEELYTIKVLGNAEFNGAVHEIPEGEERLVYMDFLKRWKEDPDYYWMNVIIRKKTAKVTKPSNRHFSLYEVFIVDGWDEIWFERKEGESTSDWKKRKNGIGIDDIWKSAGEKFYTMKSMIAKERAITDEEEGYPIFNGTKTEYIARRKKVKAEEAEKAKKIKAEKAEKSKEAKKAEKEKGIQRVL